MLHPDCSKPSTFNIPASATSARDTHIASDVCQQDSCYGGIVAMWHSLHPQAPSHDDMYQRQRKNVCPCTVLTQSAGPVVFGHQLGVECKHGG